jgi:hypothetical protein
LWDERTIENGLNFTLTTDLGDLDVLGEITAGGAYEELMANTVEYELFGCTCRCISLEELTKKAPDRNLRNSRLRTAK